MSKRRQAAPTNSEDRVHKGTSPGRGDGESVVFLVRSGVKRELERGKKKFEQGDAEGAKICYEQALDLDPECAIAYFYLGFAHHELGDLESAKECYLQAIDLDKKQTLFLEHLARLHFEQNEYSVSLIRFQEALATGPLQPISYGLMGRSFYELDRYTEAIHCLEKMLELEEEPRLRMIARYYLILSYLAENSMIPARREAVRLLTDHVPESLVSTSLAERFRELNCLSLARDLMVNLETDPAGDSDPLKQIHEAIAAAEDQLAEIFSSDEEKLLHRLHQISQFGTDKIYRLMLSLLESTSPLVKESVLDYCRRFGYEVPRSFLAECVEGEAIVREAALRYVAETYDPEYLDLMTGALEYPSREVQAAALRYLEKRGNMSHLNFLDALMERAVGAGLRRQIQRTINQIKRRHTEQADRLAATPVRTQSVSGRGENRKLKRLAWGAVGFAAVYGALRLLLLFL